MAGDDYGDFGAGMTFTVKDLATGVFKAIAAAGGVAYDKLKAGNDKVVSGMDKLKAKLGSIKDSITSLQGVAAAGILGYSVKEIGMQSLESAAKWQKFNNIIKFSSKDSQDASKNLDFLRQNSDKLGINIESSGDAFASLMGSFRGSAIQGGALRQVYDGITTAASGMGLTGEQTSGAVLALSQMMGKGTVQAEELRGQLAERIPGAMAIAARAMGTTQSALGDMMKKGELVSADFIPKFTRQLKVEFAAAAEKAANSLQANMNRIKNMFFETKVAIGEFLGPGLRVALDFVQHLRDRFAILEPSLMNFWGLLKQAGSTLLRIVGVIATFIGSLFGFTAAGDDATTMLTVLDNVLGYVNVALDVVLVTVNAVTSIFEFLSPVIKYLAIGVGILEGGFWLLNAAMTANPVGLIIKGIALLAVGLTYAYQRSAGFRGFINFLGESIKAIYPILATFGELLMNVLSGNGAGIVASFTTIKKQIGDLDFSKIAMKAAIEAEVDVAANKRESGLDQSTKKDAGPSYSYDDLLKKDRGGKPTIGANSSADKDKKKGAGSGAGKGIVVNIGKLIGELTVEVAAKGDVSGLKDAVSKALIDAIRDVEASY